MIKASVTPHDAVAYLNELVKLDPYGVAGLIGLRAPVNQAIADHPTAQVMVLAEDPALFALGPLGFLNGLFGTFEGGWGCIAAVGVPGQPETLHFRVLEEDEVPHGLP